MFRPLALALPLSLAALPAASQDLRSAFYALNRDVRVEIQGALRDQGLYSAQIDGLWGPGTAAAVAAARDSLGYPDFARTARDAGYDNEMAILGLYLDTPLPGATRAELRPGPGPDNSEDRG